jgi:hypothetical protein
MKNAKVIEMLSAQAIAYMWDSRTTPESSGVLGGVTRAVMAEYMDQDSVESYMETMEAAVMEVMSKEIDELMKDTGMKDA